MITRVLSVVLLFTVLYSCSSEQRKRIRERKIPVRPFVFQMEHYFSDAELEVSFPVWFNDSIIATKKIKKIRRSIYNELPGEEELETPKTIKEYEFDERGGLLSVNIRKLYENMVVEDVTFKYSDVKDNTGFADVEIEYGVHHLEESEDYTIWEKEKYTDKYLVYISENSGDYLFYMLDEEFWGPLSVDSVLRPNPDDIVVLGSPVKPHKRYQVEGMVKETDVVDYIYRKGKALKSISFEKYPFYYKRYVQYDKKGNCTGYIDSTFSSEDYLTRTVSRFQTGKNELPEKLTHNKPGGGGYELFEYEYYDD